LTGLTGLTGELLAAGWSSGELRQVAGQPAEHHAVTACPVLYVIRYGVHLRTLAEAIHGQILERPRSA
jgi:hypothetical protein